MLEADTPFLVLTDSKTSVWVEQSVSVTPSSGTTSVACMLNSLIWIRNI